VSDAKRLVALAESEIRNNDKLDVGYNGVIVFPFAELDDGSFEKDPDSTSYNSDSSFVVAHKRGNVEDYQFVYYIQLYGGKRGVPFTLIKGLEKDSIASTPASIVTVTNQENLKGFLNGKVDAFSSLSNEVVYYSSK